MTEVEWLKCTDPETMLDFLCDMGSERKLRLFACACCRSIRHLLRDERSQEAVMAGEAFADGELSWEQLAFAEMQANNVWNESAYGENNFTDVETDASDAACSAANTESAVSAAINASRCIEGILE